MDHEQIAVLQFDGHDLHRPPLSILAEEDDADRPPGRFAVRWRLLESNSVVGDGMTDAVLRYAVTCSGAPKPHAPSLGVYQLCQT